MKRLICSVSLPLIFLSACATQPQQTQVNILSSPAKINSSLSRLYTSDTGEVYLSWVEENTSNKTAQLLYSTLNDGKWSSPISVSSGKNWFVNWADYPSIIAENDRLAAHWLQKNPGGKYDYDVKVSFSNSNGQQWSDPFTPHTDGISAEHGFVSMLPMANQQTFITWLDGRFTKTGHGEDNHSHGHGGGAMTLRAGIFDNRSNTVDEWELDHRVCDCCQTSAAITDKGPIVAFRDRSKEEIRDISVVRYVDNKWTQPVSVHNDNWKIEGCPVNGPAITADDNHVAVAWFTMNTDVPQVKLAISQDSGETFAAPAIVSEGKTMGRVGVATLDSGDIVISWMDNSGELAQIMAAKYSPEGKVLNKVTVTEIPAARSTGFPSIAASGNNVYLSWTQVGKSNQVKTAQALL